MTRTRFQVHKLPSDRAGPLLSLTTELGYMNFIVLEEARNALTGMQYMNDLNTANVMRQLWEKLLRYLRSKWTERVCKTRSVKGQTATFDDFCQFVSEQADLATDPIYTEEGISKPMDAVEKYHKHNERKTKRGRGTNFTTG